MSLEELLELAQSQRIEFLGQQQGHGAPREWLLARVISYEVVQQSDKRQNVRLLLSILEPSSLSAQQGAEGYQLRWSEEGGIRELKWLCDEFRIPHLSSKSPQTVEQDYASVLLAHSVIRATMLLAASQEGIDPTRLSFSGARAVLLRTIARLPHLGPRKLCIWLGKMLSEIARCQLSAPQARICPRAVKVKLSKWPTKARSKSPPSASNSIHLELRSCTVPA